MANKTFYYLFFIDIPETLYELKTLHRSLVNFSERLVLIYLPSLNSYLKISQTELIRFIYNV